MKTKLLLTILIATIAASNALAVKFNFRQGGYGPGELSDPTWTSENAVVSGYFLGEDSNGDGWVSTVDSEITKLVWRYSGDSVIPALERTFFPPPSTPTFSIVYKLGDDFLGNDEKPVISAFGDREFFQFASGDQFLVLGAGGNILWDDPSTIVSGTGLFQSNSRELMYVWVPDTGSTALLLGAGLVGLAALRRRFR